MDRHTLRLGMVVMSVTSIGFVLSYAVLFEVSGVWGWTGLSTTLLLTVSIMLFGVLSLPGGRDADGNFREERVRFAIAATLVVVYLVLFSIAVLWGANDNNINKDMLDTLTDMMTIVLPFYFGTSGAVEWAKRRDARRVGGDRTSSDTDA